MARHAFIVGGAGQIGRATAKTLSQSGWRVTIAHRGARPVPIDLLEQGVSVVTLDRDAPGALHRALGSGADALIDVTAYAADHGRIGPQGPSSLETDFDGFLNTLKINTLGPLRVTQALLPNLRLSKAAPRVAIISSRMGSLSYAKSDDIAYRASKAAVNKIAQALATDLAPEGIAVASIHPGWVRTDMGGADADIDPVTSAEGVKAVIDGLSVANTGRFWNYDGTERAW